MIKKILVALWVFTGVIMLGVTMLFVAIANGWIGYLPDTSELENPNYKFASLVLSSDGKEMGTWSYSKENRVRVEFDDIPSHLIEALVATEDARFYDHSGIDGKSLLRVIVKSLIMRQENSGGGSTISQQLAKLLYSGASGSILDRIYQKPNEWVIAVNLEQQYTKEEIITMYLNKYDFGYNAVGIATAASVYFGKHTSELNIEESAMLVGRSKLYYYYVLIA